MSHQNFTRLWKNISFNVLALAIATMTATAAAASSDCVDLPTVRTSTAGVLTIEAANIRDQNVRVVLLSGECQEVAKNDVLIVAEDSNYLSVATQSPATFFVRATVKETGEHLGSDQLTSRWHAAEIVREERRLAEGTALLTSWLSAAVLKDGEVDPAPFRADPFRSDAAQSHLLTLVEINTGSLYKENNHEVDPDTLRAPGTGTPDTVSLGLFAPGLYLIRVNGETSAAYEVSAVRLDW